ncbi:MAG: HDIG domain-containing metalloprotein [bacterium]
MNRQQALELIESKVKNRDIIKHMLATEACMKAVARYLDEVDKLWGLAGLLHDVDYEETMEDFEKHGFVAAALLEKMDENAQVIYAIKAHTGKAPQKSNMAKALYAVDPLTGLIVAATLMHPSQKIANIKSDLILTNFKDPLFAKEVNRTQILSCTELGMTLPVFVKVCLEAMQSVAQSLEL